MSNEEAKHDASKYPAHDIVGGCVKTPQMAHLVMKLFGTKQPLQDGNGTDAQIYTRWRQYVTPERIAGADAHRCAARVREFADLFDIAGTPPGKRYLDFGSGSCAITSAVARAFRLTAYATDVHTWHERDNTDIKYNNVEFRTVADNGDTPFDMQFDVISCLMVMHHIPAERIEQTVRDLRRHTAPRGLLILREHDVCDDKLRRLCHIEHALQSVVCRSQSFDDFRDSYRGNYQSLQYWIDTFRASGFRLLFRRELARDNTAYSYAVFTTAQ